MQKYNIINTFTNILVFQTDSAAYASGPVPGHALLLTKVEY